MSDNFASRDDLDALALRIETTLKNEIAVIRQDMRNERLEARSDHNRLRDDVTDLTVKHGGELILHASQIDMLNKGERIAALERDLAGVRAAAIRVSMLMGSIVAAAVVALFKKVFG